MQNVRTEKCGSASRSWIKFSFVLVAICFWGQSTKGQLSAREYHNLGFTAFQNGKYKESVEYFSLAIAADGEHYVSYLDRSNAFSQMGKYENAIKDLTLIISSSDELRSKALFNRGNCYRQIGKLNEAIKDYDESINHSPIYPQVFIMRAMTFEQIGFIDKAIRDYDSAIKLDPKSSKAILNRGCLKFKKNDFKGAELDFKKLLTAKDEYLPMAYFNLGMLHFQTQNFEQAQYDFENYVKIKHEDKDGWYNLGLCLFHLNKKNLACQCIYKARDLGSNQALEFIANDCTF